MTEHYAPYHMSRSVRVGNDWDAQYAVRVGGSGGRIVGTDLDLDRYRADLLCELLEQAREAGRLDGMEE